jgi:hypothetical protein
MLCVKRRTVTVQETQLNVRLNNPAQVACLSSQMKEFRIENLNVSQIIMDFNIYRLLSSAE